MVEIHSAGVRNVPVNDHNLAVVPFSQDASDGFEGAHLFKGVHVAEIHSGIPHGLVEALRGKGGNEVVQNESHFDAFPGLADQKIPYPGSGLVLGQPVILYVYGGTGSVHVFQNTVQKLGTVLGTPEAVALDWLKDRLGRKQLA